MWHPKPAPPDFGKGRVCPEYKANFLSRAIFSWLDPLLWVGYTRPLLQDDLWDLPADHLSAHQAQALEHNFYSRVPSTERPRHWNDTPSYKKQDSSLFLAIHRTWMKPWWRAGVFKLAADTLITTTPLVNKVLLTWLTESYVYYKAGPALSTQYGIKEPKSIGYGIGLAFALFGMREISILCDQYYNQETFRIGMEQRTAVVGIVHRKSLRLSPKSRLTHSVGNIITMIAKDSETFDHFAMMGHLLWISPIQVIIGIALLIWTLGYSALAGFAIIVAGSPIFLILITLLFQQRRKGSVWTDKRVAATAEIFQGIRLIKFFSWGSFFEAKIASLRRSELKAVRNFALIAAGLMSIFTFLPVGATILAFITYALSGHNLDIPIIFTAMQYFMILQLPLLMIPMVMSAAAQVKVSLDRISLFLRAEELEKPFQIVDGLEVAVDVDASFVWDIKPAETKGVLDEEKKKEKEKKDAEDKTQPVAKKSWFSRKPVPEETLPQSQQDVIDEKPSEASSEPQSDEEPFGLSNLKLSIPHGAFHVIVGSVGSGKSSILEALVGEMRKTEGQVTFGGNIAYVPQVAWIRNQTLRENILFGQPYDATRYHEVLQTCCLEPDLEILPNGDMTEIGEKGVNLSGGQRARVSLARAVYSPYPIVLMDDPLSAVDAHVAQSLMSNCFLSGPLAKRTRVLVTHALHVLPHSDHIYMVENGKIAAQGSYEELLSTNTEFSRLVNEYGGLGKKRNEVATVALHAREEHKEAADALMQIEERLTGSVNLDVYLQFFKMAGGLAWAPLIVLVLVLHQACTIFVSLILVWWTSGEFGLKQYQYIGLYAGLGGSLTVLSFLSAFAFCILTMVAGREIYQKAFHALINAPVSYFDTTPIGRILSRLSKDQDMIDNSIALLSMQFLQSFAGLFGVVALVAYTFPLLTTIFIPLLLLYLLISVFYRATSVETKRLESILRSSLYAEVTESMTGLSTIRAYAREADSVREADEGQDMQNRAYFITFSIQRWLSVRLDTFGNILVLGIGLFAAGFRSSVNPAKIGNVLGYTLQITQSLSQMIILMAQTEQAFNSVERLLHFGILEPEGKKDAQQPPPEWPAKGQVDFQDVHMTYRSTLPPVLKGVSFSVGSGEKFAICGRTGSGKSSLIQVLLRIVEPQAGCITIDGLDIDTLDLRALRSRVAIVPQDSPLFQGTIRQNIDPEATLTDAELIAILQRTSLLPPQGVSDPVAEGKFGLDCSVSAEGSNYSAGEKQLVALCRALAKNSRIIILDEATSSVDADTDAKIQQTIRTEFADRTLLCIAHRIGTIVTYDRVLVMHQGDVGELGTILELFDQEDSMFRKLCNDASLTRDDVLKLRHEV
ncbi:multidrug resistance-associated ABC transporter [Flagelloscypha sp. PMI_526]|nr:multidrug resistance-associated ABC transporter [Flagelloscypha sp. PMI_526]